MYLPMIKNGRIVSRYQVGNHIAYVMTDCESVGNIQYLHVLYLLKSGDKQPSFAVTSETSESTGAPAPFLGIWPGDRHENHGMSPDWVDLDKFSTRALQIVAERFGIEEPPVLLPPLNPSSN